MLAVDTNIVVRYLTGDDPKQAAKARQIIRNEDTIVSKSVLLEAEWVLRTIYDYSNETIAEAFRGLAGLPHVKCEDAASVARALEWFETGIDFADALHLASAREATAFVTFDKQLARRARGQASPPVQLL